MTEPDDLAQLAARALAQGSREPSRRATTVDSRTVQLVALAIHARKRSRRVRWFGIASVAAAAMALTVGVTSRRTGAPLASAPTSATPAVRASVDSVIGVADVVQSDGTRVLAQGTAIGAGDELRVGAGGQLSFSLPTGTRIGVDEGSDLTVLEQGTTQVFRLSAGSMRAQVHKLAQGERFLVRTPDAEVEVRGTSFRVAMAPVDASCGLTTRVHVYEGVVTVRAGSIEMRVAAGETWPAACAGATSSAGSLPIPANAPPAATPQPPMTAVPSLPPSERSQLADQNDLYARAIAMRERGDMDNSLLLFARLMAKYPSSPLAENAAMERMKLLAGAHRGDAAQAASDYLSRYPAGFARKDAEMILARERNPR